MSLLSREGPDGAASPPQIRAEWLIATGRASGVDLVGDLGRAFGLGRLPWNRPHLADRLSGLGRGRSQTVGPLLEADRQAAQVACCCSNAC